MARKRKDEQPDDLQDDNTYSDEPADAPQAQAAVPRELIPDTVEYTEAKRKRDDERMADLQKGIEQAQAQGVVEGDGDTENVMVVKRSARAARQEQERIDEGKRAAEKQQPEPKPEPPPEEGTVPEWVNIGKHPFVPNAFASAPHSADMPAGPMGEHIVYVTDDIEADGTPLIEGNPEGVAQPFPEIQGYTNASYKDIDENWENHPADADADKSEPKINRHSPEGAGVEQMKLQRDVVFVPKDEAEGAGGPGGY